MSNPEMADETCDCDRCGKKIVGKMFIADSDSIVDKICYAMEAIDCLTTNKQRKAVRNYLDNQIKESE